MSYSNIVDGLHTRFATVSGLKSTLKYEPASINATPMIYSLFVNVRNEDKGQRKIRIYRTMHRLVVARQDYAQAELLALPYIDSIPDSVKVDPRLAGSVSSGLASIVEATGGYVTVDGVVYRVIDFFSEVTAKS